MELNLLIVSQEGVTWDDWCALADACERSAVPTLFAGDHYISTSDELGRVAHDAWTVIAGLAARTSVLRLGTMVSPVTFRPPAVLANAVATADHISGGRVELGLGSGWMAREHEAFGFPFPRPRVRQQMLAEQLEIVHRLWTEERVTFNGSHYTLENAPGQAEAAAVSPSPAHRRWQRHAGHDAAGRSLRRRIQRLMGLSPPRVPRRSPAGDRGLRRGRP